MPLTSAQIVVLRRVALTGDSRLTDMITLAEEQLSEDRFGDRYEYAVALLVLHWYAGENNGGAAGALTAVTEGRLSKSFNSAAGAADGNDWSTTKWGQELTSLARGLIAFPRNRMMT